MEDTQVINWEIEEEEETEEPNEPLGCNLEPLGRLRIFSSVHGPEKDFPLYLGKNVVGRMPDCSVALPFPSISKQHAVIEIFSWDKAPVLQDCGSLNGTQILRPPKVLSPGMSHRLRNQELILFGDLPCQYYRRDVSLPFVSRGPLTVEETPRVQGGTQPRGLLLAEDSEEEEVDSLAERCVEKEPSATSSTLATVVPESDEEGHSPAQDGHGPPFAFNLDSDTDEEENQPPAAREASSITETEQPKTEGGTTETQIGKDQHSVKDRGNETKVEGGARTGVVPFGVNVERSQPTGEDSDTDVEGEGTATGGPAEVRLEMTQPCGFIDSDTDVEEEGIPVTPAVVPMKKRPFFHGVTTKSPGVPGLARGQKSPTSSDTDVEEGPATVPLESRASIVIHSNTDDEEEVSAALTLACLKESHATIWNRNPEVEEHRPQPEVLKRSQTSPGRDSDTDLEEEGVSVKKRETVPKGHKDKAHSEKSQPPFGDNDVEMEEDSSSPGVHLDSSRASATDAKHQVHVSWTNKIDVEADGSPTKLPVLHLGETQPPPAEDCETDAEEGTSLAFSVVAGVRRSQLPAQGMPEQAAAVLKQGKALEKGVWGSSPVAQGKQDVPVSKNTGTPGVPTQPQRAGTQTPTGKERELHVHGTKDSGDNHDDSEDLDLQATQCFVERENQSLEAVQSMEDEPTQAFLFSQTQEPGPSHCSFQTPASLSDSSLPSALDEPWEVLATQPFCPRETEASETQPIAAYLETHGPCDSSPQGQHPERPVHTQPLGIQGHLNCKMPPSEEASRESPDVCLPPAVPEASALLQSQKYPVPQPLLSPAPTSLELPIPRTRQNESQVAPESPVSLKLELHHPEPKVRCQRSSRMTATPVSSLALEPHLATPTDQPIRFESPTQVSQVRTRRSSVKTPEPVVPIEPQLQPSTSKDQPATPKLTSQTTRGRTHRSSVKTTEPGIPIAPKHQTSTSTDQPITPEPTSRAIRGRAHRSSLKTPEPVVPTAPDLQPSTSKDHPVTPELTSRATRGRAHRSSVKNPEPGVPTAPELQPSTPTDQPVTPEPTSRATRSRAHRSSVKTPEPGVPTAPEHQCSTSKDQPVIPEPASRATRGRAHRSSVKTPEPVVPTAPDLQPSTPTDQPVTPEPTSRATRSRAHRSSVKTPEPGVPTAPDLQPSTPIDQPVIPEPTSRATRGKAHRSSVKTPEPVVPAAPDLQHSTPTDQPVTPEPTSWATRGRAHRSSVKTPEPGVPTAPEHQCSTSKDQPVIPEPASRATRGRAHRSSVKTPEPGVPTAPDLQPSTPTDQPVIPEPASRATRGRAHRSSVKTPEPVVPTAPDLQHSTPTDQPVTPEPTSRATQGRAHRSSVKTPEPGVPTAPDLQPSTPTDQPVNPEPTSRATRGRAHRSSVKTPEPGVPTAPDLQPSTPTDQPVTPEPTSRATRSRAHRSSVKTPEPGVPTAPEHQCSTSKDQPVIPEPTSRATRGKAHMSSVKTPEPDVPAAPGLQHSTPIDQPVTPEPISRATRGRAHRPSVKTPEPGVPTTSELQPSIPRDQPVTPEPTSQASRGKTHRSVKTPKPVNPTTPEIQPSVSKAQSVSPQTDQGRTHRPSVKNPQPIVPTSPDIEPPASTDQTISPKTIDQGQSRTLRSSTADAVPIPEVQSAVPTEQPIPRESIPQANGSRKPRATRKHGSLTVSYVPEPCPAPPEPNCQSSRNQRRGAVRAAEAFSATSEPASAQPPKTSIQGPQIQKAEAAVSAELILETHPKASQSCKRPLDTMDSPPPQKRLRRGEVPQETTFFKEEEEDAAEEPMKDEHVAIPGPVKRKRDQTEEPKGISSRSLRRAKPNQESTAPKVLFTGVVDARGERAVLALGGSLASSVTEASHLVTDRIRRTVKFLCALGRGIPILSLDWLHQSRKAGSFLPPDEYVVADPEQEKNFGFSLREALRRAREQRLLEGYEVHVTPGVQPPPPQMGEIISCCGGTVLPSMPRSYKPQRVVITCSQDFPRCSIPCRVGLPVVSPEFLLTGVLKQEAKPGDFVLSASEVSSA